MDRSDFRFLNRSRLTALVLITGSTLGLLAACSSDSNPTPVIPPITTGGGGSGGSGGGGHPSGDAGDGDDTGDGGTGNNKAGASNGGAGGGRGPVAEAGAGGEGGDLGDGGTGPVPLDCPTTDLGFLNAPSPSTVQKSTFDNVKRLGAHTTLPDLPI